MSDRRTIRVFEPGEAVDASIIRDTLIDAGIDATLYCPASDGGLEPPRMGWTTDLMLQVPESEAERAEAAIANAGVGVTLDERVRAVVAESRAVVPGQIFGILGGAFTLIGVLLVTPAIPAPSLGFPALAIGALLLATGWAVRKRGAA